MLKVQVGSEEYLKSIKEIITYKFDALKEFFTKNEAKNYKALEKFSTEKKPSEDFEKQTYNSLLNKIQEDLEKHLFEGYNLKVASYHITMMATEELQKSPNTKICNASAAQFLNSIKEGQSI